METLILFGAPKRNGQTAALLGLVEKQDLGRVTFVDCFQERIEPCIDCGYCRRQGCCFLRDGMDRVYPALDRCQRIILCSPVYFSELSGPLHNAISRLEAVYYNGGFHALPPKKGLILLTGGGDGEATPALESARRYLRLMQAKEIREICSLHTDTIPVWEDQRALSRSKKVIEWFLEEDA